MNMFADMHIANALVAFVSSFATFNSRLHCMCVMHCASNTFLPQTTWKLSSGVFMSLDWMLLLCHRFAVHSAVYYCHKILVLFHHGAWLCHLL